MLEKLDHVERQNAKVLSSIKALNESKTGLVNAVATNAVAPMGGGAGDIDMSLLLLQLHDLITSRLQAETSASAHDQDDSNEDQFAWDESRFGLPLQPGKHAA